MRLIADDLTPSGIGRSFAIFAGGSLLLIGGVVGLGLLAPGDGVVPDALDRLSPLVLAAIGLALMTVEAGVFTLLPAELSRRFFKSVWPGLALGGGAYIVGIHWDNGWLGLATSAWIWMIVTMACRPPDASPLRNSGSSPRRRDLSTVQAASASDARA